MKPRWGQVGLTVRSARREAGLSLRDLSLRLGCSLAYLSELERGTKRASYGTAELLAEQLPSVSLDDLCVGWAIVPPDVAALVTRDTAALNEVRALLNG